MGQRSITESDVVIVGAGLGGLRCAQLLSKAGLNVVIVEKSDRVGGRLSSFALNGFIIDEGFQLINPSYPELIASKVLKNFDLRSYDPSLTFVSENKSYQLSDPRHNVLSALKGLRNSPLSVSDSVSFAKLMITSYLKSSKRLLREPDTTTYAGFEASGISKTVIDDVVQPFLRGTLLSDDLDTSFNYTKLLLKSFVKGRPGTHPEGITALAQALAALSPNVQIDFNSPVLSVSEHAVLTENDEYRAKFVVVATDGSSAHSLANSAEPEWSPQTTWWWSLPKLSNSSGLRIDLDDRLLSSALDISSVAPERSPADRSLVATPANKAAPSTETEQKARSSVARMYSVAWNDVELITTTVVSHALPKIKPPLQLGQVRKVEGMYLAGDYLETASIQGAMMSGNRVAMLIAAKELKNT